MATPAQIAANQANSKLSTGPKSSEGKAHSSRNSFKHGLYSKDLVLPHENPAELDQLRASLRAEHQPINTTEEMLVNDLAENFWRLRRMREFETRALQPDDLVDWHQTGLFALVQRAMGSAERGFHKALTALRRLQKDRGFVPQQMPQATEKMSQTNNETALAGTEPDHQVPAHQVPAHPAPAHPAHEIGFVPPISPDLARAKAAALAELRPFLNESGALTREGLSQFAAHLHEKCIRQLDDFSKGA